MWAIYLDFDNFVVCLKQSLAFTGHIEHEALLSNHKKRHIFYSDSVVSLNSQKQANSGIKSLPMGRNQTHEILQLDKKKSGVSLTFVV